MKKPNQAPTKNGRTARNSAQQKQRTLPELAALAIRKQVLPPKARWFIDQIFQSVCEHPKTERVRVIRLTKEQLAAYTAKRPKGFLKKFLADATLQQLFPLLGATPMCWERDESAKSEFRRVALIAIYQPTLQELGIYDLTAHAAEERRNLVVQEMQRRQKAILEECFSELRAERGRR